MKLASLSTPIRHRSQSQVLASGAGSPVFHLHTVTWQADGFGFDATSGEFFTASPTALIVMQALGEGMTRLQILDRLTACFEVARSTAERDLESFLAELVHMGLAKEMN
ncbi:PqqD family protein [Prosthecobacter fluviatilis]|uniref:PqqD family protein n=1 Tax=Prosthecobacter fluviatilis TaxID=445931 RepID=A0ABW0KNN7_9BACT